MISSECNYALAGGIEDATSFTNEDTSGTPITVETFIGIVQLSGFVKSDQEKRRAGEIAGAIDGVKRVENKISIRGS